MMLALAVLLVVGLMTGLSARSLQQSHRQTRDEEQRLQAELLADSALTRAQLLLEGDPDWRGETWKVSLAAPSGEEAESQADPRTTGIATIRVERVAAEGDQFRIHVEAIYPIDPVHRAQAAREAIFAIPQQGENP